ncbi:MAG: (2Fe-2S)-binding protein [Elusimicrobia bacterium]|nr:(2Fe-2S)-binding protein [Elusimicrobiota bacterium]
MKTVKFTINGKPVEAKENSLVIDAAREAGIEVPHYCYHPALGNPGVCRLCMVEVEGMPKLQVSCRLPAKEGMVVRSNSGPARTAQAASLEFHLANHPLDCPVCDQAGECYLQDYYMRFGGYTSTMREDKVHKHKRLDIGPNVMLDSERCILCTRCVRFLDKVTKTSELGIFNRGSRSELLPYPGMSVDNPYSGNITDICPVGALTDKNFRFKVRVWYLDRTPSICTGCARGCSVEVHTNTKRPWHTDGKRVARLLPRHNPEVNDYWICDEGRYGFDYIDAPTRLKAISVMENDKLRGLTWDETVAALPAELSALCAEKGSSGLAVVLSGTLSNEDLFAARLLFVDTLKAGHLLVKTGPDQEGEEDALLRRKEKVPNLRGAQALGFGGRIQESSWGNILDGITSGKIWGLYVVDRDPSAVWGEKANGALSRLRFSAYQGVNVTHFADSARWVLPSCAYVEESGTFANFQGHVQKAKAALQPLGDARPDWMIWGAFVRALGGSFPFDSARGIFTHLTETESEFKGLRWDGLGKDGVKLAGSREPQTAGAA